MALTTAVVLCVSFKDAYFSIIKLGNLDVVSDIQWLFTLRSAYSLRLELKGGGRLCDNM